MFFCLLSNMISTIHPPMYHRVIWHVKVNILVCEKRSIIMGQENAGKHLWVLPKLSLYSRGYVKKIHGRGARHIPCVVHVCPLWLEGLSIRLRLAFSTINLPVNDDLCKTKIFTTRRWLWEISIAANRRGWERLPLTIQLCMLHDIVTQQSLGLSNIGSSSSPATLCT